MSEEIKKRINIQNQAVVANMIEIVCETLMEIDGDFIEVGQTREVREEMAETAGAMILSSILKQKDC